METLSRLGVSYSASPQRAMNAAPATTPAGAPCGLTAREVEVLQLVARGLANKQIAARLELSQKTVERHLSNIYVKTGVSSRAAATAFAFTNNLTASSA
jgi:DNA-binding NarL/FixJ family response regulator